VPHGVMDSGAVTGPAGAVGPRSNLEALLRAGEFVVTSELQTSDGADPASVTDLADTLRGSVDAVNCTDNSAAHPHISAVAAAHLLADRGVEPVVQFACRDRNRLSLQADLLGAAALGATNVVCMTGDDVTAGDHPEAKPVYDLDSTHLLRVARTMRDGGTYISGRALSSPPAFFIGAVENPFAPPFDFRPMRLGKKIEAGAEFIQTQIVFNLPRFRTFMARVGELGLLDHVFVIAGIFIPRSAGSARYLRDQVPGIDVPEEIVTRMEAAPKDRQAEEGLQICLELVEQVRGIAGVSGVHLMSIGQEQAILRLIRESGLLPRPVSGSVAARSEAAAAPQAVRS
jgi:methylenetetrahydrofolate reductase (NADPH)